MAQVHADNRNVLYGKIKRTIFFVVAVLVLLASAFFYQYNISLLTDRVKQADMQILKTHKEASEVMQRLAYNITRQVFNDPQIAYLLYNTNFNSTELLRAIAQLNNYRACIPYIESIYVYNANLRSMTVSSPHSGGYDIPIWQAARESDLFFDRPIVDILEGKARRGTKSAPIPRLITYPDSYNPPTFCYTYTASAVYGDDPLREAVFVNFSIDWMRQIAKEIEGSQSHTLVVNEDGIVVFSLVDSEGMWDISGERLFGRIGENTHQPESFTVDFKGEKTLVSVLPADVNNWNYVRVTPYAYITQNILGAVALMLAVDAGLILLGLLGTFIAARRLYVPIEAISNRLDFAEREKAEMSGQQTLRKELLGPVGKPSMPEEDAADTNGGYVLIVRAERPGMASTRGQWAGQLTEMVRTAFSFAYSVQAMELDEGISVALVLEGTAVQGADWWRSTFAGISTRLQERRGVAIRGALSHHGSGDGWKALCFRQAREAMRYRILSGQGQLILWERVQALSMADYAYPQDKEKMMTDQILGGNAEAAKETMHRIMDRTQGQSLITVQLTVSTLTIALLNITEEIRRSSFVSLSPAIREALLAVPSLDDVETLEEVTNHFAGIIDELCISLGERREAKHLDLLEHINALIEANYQDPNCSLSFIAEQTNLSAAHVGRLYKQYTLRSIPDTIQEVRLSKARQLLTEKREMSIEQIALRTGFSSGSYFSKAFRRAHGMSPNEYRNFALRDGLSQAEKEEDDMRE